MSNLFIPVASVFAAIGVFTLILWAMRSNMAMPEPKATPRDDPDVVVAHGGPLDGIFIELEWLNSSGQKRLQERGSVISLSEWNPYLSPSRTPRGYTIEQMTRSEAKKRGFRSFV